MATPNYNLPTITGNMTADVVRDMNALAEATDSAIKDAVSGVDARLNTHLAETAVGAHKAKNIALEDADGLFVGTEVETAMKELFTSVSNGKQLIGTAITDVDDSLVVPTNATFQQLADLIRMISTGKKWASGVATSGASTIYFKDSSGTNRYATPLTVTGLSFRPTTVLAYFADGVLTCAVSAAEGVPKDSYGYHRAIINTSNLNFRVDGAILRLINGEFNIPVSGNNTQFHWIAFE